MDIEENLLILKGEDKTEVVKKCTYKEGKCKVEFQDQKVYTYNESNVQWLRNPVTFDPSTTVVYKDTQPLSGVNKILDFKYYIRVGFVTGYKKVYPRNDLVIEQSCLMDSKAKSGFEYLQQLAKLMKINEEDEQSFVSKQFERITYVSPSSVLSKYLNPSTIEKTRQNQEMPVFPFGFNLSQKAATEKALTEQISVIEGPPGTGKTQTILNIIANAVMKGETVAVVSNNNSATANVLEKLQKYDLDFIAAFLGNKSNKEKFFSEQKETYPNIASWVLEAKDYTTYTKRLSEAGHTLKEMLEVKNQLAQLKQELSVLLVEKEYFYTYYRETSSSIKNYQSLYPHKSETILSLWLDFQQRIKKRGSATFLYKIKNLFWYGITNFSFYNNSEDQIISHLQKLYYEQKEKELKEQIDKLSKRLKDYHFEESMEEYCNISMKLFKAQLAQRYPLQKERRKFTRQALWNNDFSSFIKEYPVILSTTHSLRTCMTPNYLFDYVIMDEASQVDIVTGALALSCARNAVIVGDLKQLPNVVSEDLAKTTNSIYKRFSLPAAFNYAESSMLSSITSLFEDIPKTLLREHYRCHPKIIGFCNSKFYNDELIILTEDKAKEAPLVLYKTTRGNHARGRYNQRQIDVILEEVLPQQTDKGGKQDVGIISPFRMQTEKLKCVIRNSTIEVDTVHKYQGREKDVVILTTVVNDVNDFVDNPNLINVAVSRAVNKLIIVTSDHEKSGNSNLDDLVRYIEYNNFEIIHSNIYSVFDLLYHSYSDRLLSTLKQKKRVSEYESENLMNVVIERVLSLPEFQNLNRVMHQPLRMLIRNPEKLNDTECKFAMNILTHTDFVIFNRLDKRPVLVVEVDGYAYHENNPKQLERDRMKDAILEKYGIPILRVKTNESGEEERLRKRLGEALIR